MSTSAGEVDLIVFDWDGGEALINCLHSIDTQSRPPSRIIILDNGSHQPTYQRLAKDMLKLPYVIVRNETYGGLAGGINRAMVEVRAPFVAWVNDYAVLADKWLEKLLPVLSGEGKIAGVQSIILRDKTTIETAGTSVDKGVFSDIGQGQKLANLKQLPQPWAISSTAALFRTNALAQIGGAGMIAKPDFSPYYEDVELCARLRAKGWRFKLVPEALALRRSAPTATRLGMAGFRMRIRNRYKVAKAHRGSARIVALLSEDLSSAAKEVSSGHVRVAFERVKGMLQGIL